MLPFSREVYFSLFAQYGSSLWWLHVLGMLIALGVIGSVVISDSHGRPGALLALSVLWAGTSWFWFFGAFADLNFMARVYGWIAMGQAGLLLLAAVLASWRRFGDGDTFNPGILGWTALGCGFLYPVFDLIMGPGWPAVRLPGFFAEPAILMNAWLVLGLSMRRFWWCLVLPLLLSAVTAYTAWVLGLWADWIVPGLVGAAFVAPACARFLPEKSTAN